MACRKGYELPAVASLSRRERSLLRVTHGRTAPVSRISSLAIAPPPNAGWVAPLIPCRSESLLGRTGRRKSASPDQWESRWATALVDDPAGGEADALKLLQSEGRLTIASAGKDGDTGRQQTQHYEVEGPVAMLLTTTAEDPDAERLVSRSLCQYQVLNATQIDTDGALLHFP